METKSLKGQIKRITYTSEDTGYSVLDIEVFGDAEDGSGTSKGMFDEDMVETIVGYMFSPAVGELLELSGDWKDHDIYGRQFAFSEYTRITPESEEGLVRYLGSGLIDGIGEVTAQRIVDKFGTDTLEVLDATPQKLRKIKGIGKKNLQKIIASWEAQQGMRKIMIFLAGHGISQAYCAKIIKEYGENSIRIVSENPYRLASEIQGIGFIVADTIAEKLGFGKNSALRIEAGILYVLGRLSDDGHVLYPLEELLEKAVDILKAEKGVVEKALKKAAEDKKVVIEQDTNLDRKDVYLTAFHVCETSAASKLCLINSYERKRREIDVPKAIAWAERTMKMTFAGRQNDAVNSALEGKVTVITGGPGTGKTTIINAVIGIHEKLGMDILLAAPTGRAAKRMSETSGKEARTIHRLLEFSVVNGGFMKNEESPLDCDLLIIDEASMIDIVLMHHLLKAVPVNTSLIFVGDVYQLPSVGAGSVLRDIIDSNAFPVVELDVIFRQAEQSGIVTAAHMINSGSMPPFKSLENTKELYFIRKEAIEDAVKTIVTVVKDRIPTRFGLDPKTEIQVLTPMNKGPLGAAGLNIELQKALNPGAFGITRGDKNLCVNDKVMQIKNNYDKDVFNGDIGVIEKIRSKQKDMDIRFDRKLVTYDFSELDEIVLAYAVTVHKSQGSEYPAVVVPMAIQHYILLQRNLLYTAVTRGKGLVVIVGTDRALHMAINNNKTEKRFSKLKQRLRINPGDGELFEL